VVDRKQSKKQAKEQEASQKRALSQQASSQNSASQDKSDATNGRGMGMGSKTASLRKSNTPSGAKNKILDMMKSSLGTMNSASKLQSSVVSSSSAKRDPEAQEYEGGQTRNSGRLLKRHSLPS